MTEDQFRAVALLMPDAVEGSHMANADFRAGGPRGRIFASIWAEGDYGMVKLTPEQQAKYVRELPDVFEPVKGKWGEGGATRVTFKAARVGVIREVMKLAWGNVAKKK